MAAAIPAIAVGISAIGAGASVYSSYQQSMASKNAANNQANAALTQAIFESQMQEQSSQLNQQVAGINAQMAEDEGKAAKAIAHENEQKKRMEVASIISSQRAAAGASGAQVDQGSFIDLQLDTVEKGELDALALREQGMWQDYSKRIEAHNYRMQGLSNSMQAPLTLAKGNIQSSLYRGQANSYTPWLSAGSSLINGAGNIFGAINKNYF